MVTRSDAIRTSAVTNLHGKACSPRSTESPLTDPLRGQMGQTALQWETKPCSFYSQKPFQRLRYPFHLPFLPRPQRHRRLSRLEPERHHPLAPDGGVAFRSSGLPIGHRAQRSPLGVLQPAEPAHVGNVFGRAQEFPAEGFHLAGRGVHVVHGDINAPGWGHSRALRRQGHHPADRSPTLTIT